MRVDSIPITESEFKLVQICPICGERLLTNFQFVWCSNIGLHDIELGRKQACEYGIMNTVYYDYDYHTVLQS